MFLLHATYPKTAPQDFQLGGAFPSLLIFSNVELRRLTRATMELLLIFGIPLATGFAAGYSLREYQSRRNRRLARQFSLWQMPPKQL
jgi:hypothetical protein